MNYYGKDMWTTTNDLMLLQEVKYWHSIHRHKS